MFFRAIFLFLLISSAVFGNDLYLSFNGYLNKSELESATLKLQSLNGGSLAIELNSSGGDLALVLDFVRLVYQKKQTGSLKEVDVYIADQAIGPAALVPFIADRLYIAPSVAWGDVNFGSEGVLPANLLKSRLVGFIDPASKNAPLLKTIAIGMVDKNALVVSQGGSLKLAEGAKDADLPVISGRGEALVLNQNSLQSLNLSLFTLSLNAFQKMMGLSDEKRTELENLPSKEQQLAVSPKTLQESLQKHIQIRTEGANTIGLIKIGDHDAEINQATWLLVKNALDYYKAHKPIFIILELNTPGGEVFAAQKISDALKEFDTQQGVPVVAYVNNWAISAGAMLSYSCRYIVVVKDGAIGAAEPVTIVGEELKEASEKVNSALRADFANRARFFGRNPLIAEAMVDKSLLLVLRHGEIVKLNDEKELITTGPSPDIVISAKGKLLTLNAEEAVKYGVADLMLMPKKLLEATAEQKQSGKMPFQTELLSEAEFFNQIPNAFIDAYRPDWKTDFFMLLASPLVSSALFLGFIVGLYIEISSPGFGLPGSIAVSCLILMILSSFSLEIANWLEVILLLIGALIIAIELFVLPTFGLLGFFGAALFLIGFFGMLLPGADSFHYEFDTHTLNAAGEAFFEKLAWYSATLVVGFVVIALLASKISPKWGAFRKFVLSGGEQEGYYANDPGADFPPVGTTGEVFATLRPAGKVILNHQIYDAVSMTGFIEKGEKVIVTGSDTGNLVVAQYFNEGASSK